MKGAKAGYIVFYTIGLITMVAIGLRCGSNDPQKTEQSENQQIERASQFKNLHDTIDYVGMQKCRQCHEDKYQSFKKTGMGQSFDTAHKAKSAGRFDGHQLVYDSFKNLYYKPFWKENDLYVKEFKVNGQGDTTFKRVEQIDYIIGSGQHTNSHMYAVNGYIYQAPFTFYTQEEQWDLPPGYELGNNSRFTRPIGIECMSCHNAYPDFESSSKNKFSHVPSGIDCERCHGPGELHVKEKQAGNIVDTENGTDHTIVNPSKLPNQLKNDVCQRCHLQGNAVLKEGKSFFDFKPGMNLSSVMDVFRPVYKKEDAFIMASHSERLQQSKCFKSTQDHQTFEPLNCITCHNPHKSVESTSSQYFNKTCQSCHKKEKEDELVKCAKPLSERISINDNNCTECHMQKSKTLDIPHVSISDHKIDIPDDDTVELDRETYQNLEITKLKSYNNPDPSYETVGRAYLYFYEKFEARSHLLDSAFNYLQQLPPDSVKQEWVHYYYLKEDWNRLVQFVNNQGITEFSEAMPNYRIGQAFDHIGRAQKAIAFYQKAIAQKPYNLNFHKKLGNLYLKQKALSNAEKEFKFVLKENPKNPMVHNNLALIYLNNRQLAKAEEHIQQAMNLKPDYGAAALNMAKVLYATKRQQAAINKLKMIIQKYPDQRPQARQLLQKFQSASNS